jgi:uncharacterized protein
MQPKLSKKFPWKKLENLVKKALKKEKTGHDYDHAKRTVKNALLIAKHYKKVDYDVLIASCWLHDIVSKPSKIHHRIAAKKAAQILKKFNFPKDKIKAVQHAIINHNRAFSLEKPTPISKLSLEAKLLYDADMLDAIGAVGLIRAISFVLHTPQYQDMPYFVSKKDKLDQSFYGNVKYLIEISKRMMTPPGKKLGKQRAKILKDFLRELEKEC